jgi:hypothetical protein
MQRSVLDIWHPVESVAFLEFLVLKPYELNEHYG